NEIIGLAESGDLAELRRHAHNLVSTAGGVGALQLADRARRLEGACQAQNDREARALARDIATVANPAYQAMRERIAAADA
ncbi:MAG TPA: Hpt domain-containing protein, partial [Stellaceae bacterium]|nr:Hpt domain-containing protein [Stellaceae bacterium]